MATLSLVSFVAVFFAFTAAHAWLFVGKGDPDQDKLTGSQSAQNAPSPAAAASDKFCGSRTVYDLIKRDLFRRAAQLRGGDAAAYDQVSNSAVLRMERPVLVSETKDGLIRCSGFLSRRLTHRFCVERRSR